MKVVLATPTLSRPFGAYLKAVKESVPALDAAGIDHQLVFEVGCPYISAARATMLRKALDAKADVVVFIDHDLSWEPGDLLRLIETKGDVVAGTYRFKKDDGEYMGRLFVGADRKPIVRSDGCIKAERIPAGFLKITAEAVHRLMQAHPELCYGPRYAPCIDLFNHGAHEGVWWGEDYAFSRRWNALGGEIWVIPDLNLVHHAANPDGSFMTYPGNFHEYLCRLTGGTKQAEG